MVQVPDPSVEIAAFVGAVRRRLRAAQAWRGVGVGSTPAFSVNGKMLTLPDGSSPGASADVVGAIEAALKTQK